VIVW